MPVTQKVRLTVWSIIVQLDAIGREPPRAQEVKQDGTDGQNDHCICKYHSRPLQKLKIA